MKVLYLFPHPCSHPPRSRILKECLKNNYPDTLLMGLTRLKDLGIEYDFLDLDKFSAHFKTLFTITSYDIIVCKDASSGLLLGLFKKWGLIKKPLIFLDVVVHENIKGIKLKFLRYILSGVDRIIYCAPSLKTILNEYFNVENNILQYLPWAIDDIFFQPMRAQEEPFIFSAGNNDRDYKTLMEAVKGTAINTKIATNLRLKNVHTGIEIICPLEPISLRNECSRAKFMVVPLYDVPSASGATALLESMAMGKAAIISNSRGIRGFVKDGHDAVIVESGNVISLRKAIIYLNDHPQERERIGLNARKAVENYFSTAKQARNLAEIYKELARG